MVNISKEDFLFKTDDKGGLVPLEVELIVNTKDENQAKLAGKTVKIFPLKRSELKTYLDKSMESMKKKEDAIDAFDINAELVVDKCAEPKFTKEDIPFMKPMVVALVNTILQHSGLGVKPVEEPKTDGQPA
jgi:hypothetical protein